MENGGKRMSICNGVAGVRGHVPKGATIHNDGGSNGANANFYNIWLRTHDLGTGYAHYYAANDYILQAEDDGNCAWHCANTYGNFEFLSFEACQSMGDEEQFLKNETSVLKLVAQKFLQYGIIPNNETVTLHQEFSSTACPHRSVAIHGGMNETKKYFIQKIKTYMGQNVQINTGVGLDPEEADKIKEKNNDMRELFTVNKGATVYYFDGYAIRNLIHPDEMKVLNDIYKANHGTTIPFVDYKSHSPYYKRLLNVLNRAPLKTM